MNYKEMKQRIIQALPDWLFVRLKGYGWSGNYKTWAEVKEDSVGYDADNIVQKVKASTLKVKSGEAVYERDSVLFYKEEYRWELLTALLWIAAQEKGELHVMDFGGALGSTWYQNKRFLETLPNVTWNVVEQKDFVKIGLESFQDEHLHFYSSLLDCFEESEYEINVVLFSSALQYMEEPYAVIDEICLLSTKYIIVDRTGFTPGNGDRLTVQKVSEKKGIYKATYPCWFLDQDTFLRSFGKHFYESVFEFDGFDVANVPSKYKGFVLKCMNYDDEPY